MIRLPLIWGLMLCASLGCASASMAEPAPSEPAPSEPEPSTAPAESEPIASTDLDGSRTRTASESPSPAEAQATVFAWSTTYATRKSFQRLDYSEGRPVFQPFASASRFGFTAGLWGNADQSRQELNEVDATLQRDFERGLLSGGLGYAYLHYPHRDRADWAPTNEAYFDLSLDAPLAPSLSVHWDVDAGAGRYWTLGFGHEFARGKSALGLSAKLYAHEHYYGMTGIPAVETGVSFSSPLGWLVVQPSLARMWTFENGDFRDDLAIAQGWVASLNLSPR